MLLNLFNVVYVLVAIAMAVMILLQRGSGAQAGSGFGGGASGTVFGARGAATFLSRATAFLAGLFFLLSLGMAAYLGHARLTKPSDDLGVMSGVAAPTKPLATPKPAPAATDVPSAPTATQSAAPDAAAAAPVKAVEKPVEKAPEKSAAATKPQKPENH